MFRSFPLAICFLSAFVVPLPAAEDGPVARTANQPIASKRLTDTRIMFVAHHKSGEALWIVTDKAQLHIVDPRTLEPLDEPTTLFNATVSGVGLLPDQSGMLLCTYGGEVIPVATAKTKTADWVVGEKLRPVAGETFQSIAVAPTGSSFVLGTRSGRVALFDMTTGALRWNVSIAETPINSLAWSRDEKRLAACSGDWQKPNEPGFAYLLDLNSGDVLKRLAGHRGQVNQVAFSPDGKSLTSISSDSRLLTYELEDLQKPPAELKRSSGSNALLYLRDGRCVVSIYGGGVEVCDLRKSRSVIVFSGHKPPAAEPGKPPPRRPLIRAVSVAPDGAHLVTTDFNGMAYVWSLSDAVASPDEYDKTHWNADATADVFQVGTFAKADEQGRPVGWEDLSAFDDGRAQLRTSGRRSLTLSSAGDDGETSIATHFDIPPKTQYVTFMVRLRGPTIERSDQMNAGGGVTFSLVDSEGKYRDMPRVDPPYKGYRDWTNRLHTAKVLPGETKIRVGITLVGATGELEVNRILIVPSRADDEATDEQIHALSLAVDNDDADAIARLIKGDARMLEMRTGASDNGTPLIRAAWNDSAKVAAKLIELGADIEARDDNWGNTPLRWCCWWGNHEVAALLVDAGAETSGASRMAQYAKTGNGAAKRAAEDFDKVSKLIDEHEAQQDNP